MEKKELALDIMNVTWDLIDHIHSKYSVEAEDVGMTFLRSKAHQIELNGDTYAIWLEIEKINGNWKTQFKLESLDNLSGVLNHPYNNVSIAIGIENDRLTINGFVKTDESLADEYISVLAGVLETARLLVENIKMKINIAKGYLDRIPDNVEWLKKLGLLS